MTRYLLVANPTAHSGKARARIERTIERIVELGLEVDFLPTKPAGGTVAEVSTALQTRPYDVCVYMGGDGTFNEVARGIMASGTHTPMGMMPSGTANDQGRSFGVRASEDALEKNLAIVAAGHITHLDAGRLRRLDDRGRVTGETLFFDSAGWGLQSDILVQRNVDKDIVGEIPILRELYRDKLVYVGAVFDKLMSSYIEPVKFSARLVADGREMVYEGLTDLVIKATAIYGGSWVLARYSEPDDGRFEPIPIQGRRDWASKALRDLASIPIWQEHLDLVGVTHAEGFSASHFELELRREEGSPVSAQVDGEEWLTGHFFEVAVLPGAIKLITPADFAPPWKIDRI